MGDKQSGHNDISPSKLNSIHHKVVINTNRVDRIDSTDYNTSCNCEMRWDGDGDGADVGDDVDDDPDDARDDDDYDDGDDLPFREVFSTAESARRKWLFFSVGFRHEAAAKLRVSCIFRVFSQGDNIGHRGRLKWDQGPRALPARPRGRPGGTWGPGGSPLAHLWASPVIFRKNGL